MFSRGYSNLVFAVRILARTPGVTAAILVSLALGLGANVAFFSVVNAVAWKKLPVTNPERLVIAKRVAGETVNDDFSHSAFREMSESGGGVDGLGAWYPLNVTTRVGRNSARARVELVSENYFSIVGVRGLIGGFLDRARSSGDTAEAIVGYAYATSHLGGVDGAIGQSINVNGILVTVVGVAPRDFGGLELGLATDLWLPLTLAPGLQRIPDILSADRYWWLHAIGRLKPGTDAATAEAALTQALRWIAIAALTSLLIVCSNVAWLMVGGFQRRRREFAVRLALGANRSHLVSQLVMEVAILSLLAVLAGLLVAHWTSHIVSSMIFGGHVTLDVTPDWRVFVFSSALGLSCLLLFSLLALFTLSDKSLMNEIRPASWPTGLRSGVRRYTSQLPLFLQVTLAMFLLLQTGLFIRTFINLRDQRLGFDPDNLVFAQIDPAEERFTEASFSNFANELMERLRGIPGVQAASYSRTPPLSPLRVIAGNITPEAAGPDFEPARIEIQSVEKDYFETLRMPFVAGASFSGRSRSGGSPIPVVINETLARRYFEGDQAVGGRLTTGESTLEVVGVVADANYHSLREAPVPVLYAPYLDWPGESQGPVAVLARTEMGPGVVTSQVRSVVAGLGLRVALTPTRTMGTRISELLIQEQSLVRIGLLLSLLGVLLVGIGVYGTVSQFISARRKDLAIRLALGATHQQVFWLACRMVALAVPSGLMIGFLLADGITRVVESLLFGVTSTDVLVLLTSAATVVLASALGVFVPLLRTKRLDPASLLRVE